jgi:cytochrome P450
MSASLPEPSSSPTSPEVRDALAMPLAEAKTTEAGVSPDQLVVEIMLSPEGRADPYPRYKALREVAPVHKSDFGPVWFLTRYGDSRTMLRDNRFGKSDPDPDAEPNPLFGPSRARRSDPVASRSLLALNPPDHTRLRGLVSRGFTPKRVEQLRPAVEAMTDDILDEMAREGDVDVLDVLGFPLPVRVIGELVGVPEGDRDRFRTTVRTAAAALEPGTTEAELDAATDAAHEMQAYFRDLIAKRRADPLDDLTSALIAARDEEDQLTEDEMVVTLLLIFAAGFETTTNLIGNGLLALLRHPDEMARVRDDPALVPAAVDEILRFESPVQVDARRALEDADIAGVPVPAGDWVVTFLGGANRDPAVFEEPERFRIGERSTPVLSFASGIHYCLGASLARLEGQCVFGKLLQRFEHIEWLDDEPAWRNTLILRGLTQLPVRVR